MSKNILRAFSAGIILSSGILAAAYFMTEPKETTKAVTASVTDQDVQNHLSAKDQIAVPRKDYEKLIALKESAVAKSGEAAPKPAEAKPAAAKPFSLTIQDGMSTGDIAKVLEQAGMVSSARDYATYLADTGNQTKVRAGTFRLKQGMSFKQITRVLVK
ncbi:endolytic transglycosylase MltG [Metabacillus sp. GX 13764]|uniref:endolytic transglycosylase MltG n=1 Tax=Metabacillus kandeliae TaxID=2900151 RepID=UPI001E511183|nr:endolytic transglycosylase MltG [Metabacillus kandeliae]MCD7033102.1 endolytic transglycosylase MltG [Metabacillus kandeliae]